MSNYTTAISAFLIAISLGPLAAQTTATRRTGEEVSAAPLPSPRQRLSINDDWRFKKDDPPGNTTSLLYDVRPEVRDRRDDAPADARPETTERLTAPAQAVIKQWILPTGNRFIKDPGRRFARPKGNWGGEVAYVRRDFDDGSWRRVNLPHDWAIEGPFLTTGPSGGMGRLPSPGVGWYRKKWMPMH